MSNPYKLFKSRRFLPLFVVQFLGAMNDNIYKNALIILVSFSLAQLQAFSPKMPLAIASGLFILPYLLFSAISGELADRLDKEKMIQWVKLAEVLILGIAATLGFYLQSLFLLYLTVFLLGTHSTFFGPLKYAILPQHLAKEELLFGNSWIEASTFLAILSGTLLGGLLILKPNGIFIISLLLFSLALIGWFASFFIPKAKSENPNLKINYNIFKATYDIIHYTFKRKEIRLPVLGISWFWFIGSSFLTIVPLYTKEVLQSNETTTTLLLTLVTVGIGIGSLASYILLRGKITAKFVPLANLGLSLFCFLLIIKPLVYISAFGIGLCGGIYSVPLYALLQYKSDAEYRSRNIASNNIMNALFMIGSSLIAMFVFQLNGGSITLLTVIAILNLAVTLYLFWAISKNTLLNIVSIFIKCIFKILYRVKINNLENLPPKGERAMIIANHVSLLDAALIRLFISDHFTYPIDTDTSKKL
ncbi:MAG: acyl-[ACP]--phospholipid O-acyltransferase, partial [Verrucomicrobia bacterium]